MRGEKGRELEREKAKPVNSSCVEERSTVVSARRARVGWSKFAYACVWVQESKREKNWSPAVRRVCARCGRLFDPSWSLILASLSSRSLSRWLCVPSSLALFPSVSLALPSFPLSHTLCMQGFADGDGYLSVFSNDALALPGHRASVGRCESS